MAFADTTQVRIEKTMPVLESANTVKQPLSLRRGRKPAPNRNLPARGDMLCGARRMLIKKPEQTAAVIESRVAPSLGL